MKVLEAKATDISDSCTTAYHHANQLSQFFLEPDSFYICLKI